MYSDELYDLYSPPNIIRVAKSRRMRWVGHAARMGDRRDAHKVLVGVPEGKRPLERRKHRWEDNMKMDLQQMRWGCMDWLGLAPDTDEWRAVLNAVMSLRVPKSARNFLTI